MKILIVSQYFWPESFRINDLAEALVSQGNKVTVLTGIPNYPTGRFFEGYRIFRPFRETRQAVRIIRAPLISRGNSKGLRLVLNYISFAIAASLIGALFCRDDYDAILVYEPSPITVGLPALPIKAIRKSPVFFWVQDLWPESLEATGAVRSPFVLKIVGKLVKFIYRRSDLILIPSNGFRNAVASFGILPEKIVYFPNSAEEFYKPKNPDPNSDEARLMPSGFRLVFAGNIGAAQDFETILAAAEMLKDRTDLHWIILGDGRMKSWVETEVVRRNLSRNFHLLGRFPVERMPQFFAVADALLVTLKDEPIFALTIPTKIQSYLACGRPVLASIRGEGARVIDEAAAGVTCAPQNPESLAAAVVQLLEMSPNQRARMGSNGRTYFEKNFDSGKLLTDLEGWMRQVAQKGAS